MATTVRNIKKNKLPNHDFYTTLAEEMIRLTDYDVEQTLSKNLLGNDMYNNLYVVDDIYCVNQLVHCHFSGTNEHLVTNCQRCDVCQMEFNVSKKNGIMRNSLRSRRQYNISFSKQCQLHIHDIIQNN